MDIIGDDSIDPCRDWSEFHHRRSGLEKNNIVLATQPTPSPLNTDTTVVPKPNRMEYNDCIDPCREWSGFHRPRTIHNT